MSAFPFPMVGFDLDGTLVDSNADLAPAINHALSTIGRGPIAPDATRRLIGGGSRLMLERALNLTGGMLDDADFPPVYDAMIEHYSDHITDHTLPYPGCLAALDDLDRRGVTLAVVTNKPEHLARKLLDELDMTARFAAILGGDSLPKKKPEPDQIHEAIRQMGQQGRFAMVGDSSFDVRAARNAGAPCAVFSFGYLDMDPADMDAAAVLDHWDELVPALLQIGAE